MWGGALRNEYSLYVTYTLAKSHPNFPKMYGSHKMTGARAIMRKII